MPRDSLLRGEEVEPLRREPRVLTPQEKRRNWWDYHKIHLLVAAAAILVLFSIFYSVFSKVKPDYHIAVVTSYTFPEAARSELERCLEQFAEDRNGDDKTVVDVATYSFATTEVSTPEQLQQQQSEMARFTVDTGQNDSMIFLFDRAEFELMESNFGGFFLYNDGTPMPETAEDYENAQRPWSDFPGLAGFTPKTEVDAIFTADQLTTLFERLFVCVRSPEGYFDDNEETMAYYRDSMALYDRLLTGETP